MSHTTTATTTARAGRHLVPDGRLGTSVDGFVIDRLVARGPHAVVYHARRAAEQAAVKIYEPGASSAAWDERWRRERVAWDRVNHRSVARLLGAGLLPDGAAFMVSPWIEGQRLEDRLAPGPIGWDAARPIVMALGAGLGAIHGAGVVHRDLKPANILLPASGKPAAVILDFGHSLVLGEKRLTADGFVLGSAPYMAPEQTVGHAIDGRADFYALGVVLYRMLTGALPFAHENAADMLVAHQSEPVAPPRKRCPEAGIPEIADDLCMWLLAKDAAARMPNARVLAVTLGSLS